jgi:hypothetical protein
VDVNGSGLAAGQDALDSLGIASAELQTLATLYTAGQTLLRVPVTHFSAWDFNWPYGLPPWAAPPPDTAGQDPRSPKQCKSAGSIIGCENQTLGESIGLVGTPFLLTYASDRTRGREELYRVNIPLTRPIPPDSLLSIKVEVSVAGRQFGYAVAPAPALDTTFTWDGKDAFGRTLQGRQRIKVRVGYLFKANYSQGASFASYGTGTISIATRVDPTFWTEWNGWIGAFDAQAFGLGGWSLDAHHIYDAASGILYRGDGTQRAVEHVTPVVMTVAGNGQASFPADLRENIPATDLKLSKPWHIAARQDGGFYFHDQDPIVREVKPDGSVVIVAGTGVAGFSGDGGQARQAQLSSFTAGISIGPDGSLYIADTYSHRIRRVAPDGIITTIAGNGTPGFSGDGGLATLASLNFPEDVAAGRDGSVYIADRDNRRIRRVSPKRNHYYGRGERRSLGSESRQHHASPGRDPELPARYRRRAGRQSVYR